MRALHAGAMTAHNTMAVSSATASDGLLGSVLSRVPHGPCDHLKNRGAECLPSLENPFHAVRSAALRPLTRCGSHRIERVHVPCQFSEMPSLAYNPAVCRSDPRSGRFPSDSLGFLAAKQAISPGHKL